ncbi:hypothetical protein DXG01_007003 [Tephrocybe rancida]|nr:hypothetical protein DXG01_007003 [Tephrocybe rancida]
MAVGQVYCFLVYSCLESHWNGISIASECTQIIGPMGYGYVQVSPAYEHVQGANWWSDYQPVSYQLVSKRGLGGLADLAQEQQSVRNALAAHLNDLLSLASARLIRSIRLLS